MGLSHLTCGVKGLICNSGIVTIIDNCVFFQDQMCVLHVFDKANDENKLAFYLAHLNL